MMPFGQPVRFGDELEERIHHTKKWRSLKASYDVEKAKRELVKAEAALQAALQIEIDLGLE